MGQEESLSTCEVEVGRLVREWRRSKVESGVEGGATKKGKKGQLEADKGTVLGSNPKASLSFCATSDTQLVKRYFSISK